MVPIVCIAAQKYCDIVVQCRTRQPAMIQQSSDERRHGGSTNDGRPITA